MHRKKTFFTKEEIAQRKKDGEIAFNKRKQEKYEKYIKKYSHIIFTKGQALSLTIKVDIGNDVKYIAFNTNTQMIGGYWLIPEKYYEKALIYTKSRKLKMEEISYILSL